MSLSLIESVPVEVWNHILSYLSANELCKLSRVSSVINIQANDEMLWKELIKRNFKEVNFDQSTDIKMKEVFKDNFIYNNLTLGENLNFACFYDPSQEYQYYSN